MTKRPTTFALAILITALPGCTDQPPAHTPSTNEVVSLLGTPLPSPTFDDSTKTSLADDIATAQSEFDQDPSLENFVWLGRRLAYEWRYEDAIRVYSDGIEQYPDAPELYRHRGHRYISVRQFDRAVEDLEAAARLIDGTADQVELDGQPNAFNIPTSTLHFNVWYHLGLAYYLRGQFDEAAESYRRCIEVSRNDDSIVAATDWLYMALRRDGRHVEAEETLTAITDNMTILENDSYHNRLLMYKGVISPDSLLHSESELDLATQGYGVGNWYLYTGDRDRAFSIFRSVASRSYWPAFGFIAAEAELAREGS